jgi:phosphatidylinositol 4-kinase
MLSCLTIYFLKWTLTGSITLQTLPAGFLLIASGLTSAKLRSDYRHRLLSLCSDVGLAAESKSGRYNSVITFMLIASHDGVSCDFSF